MKQPFDDLEWVFEFKYDGFRALNYIEDGRSWFASRSGNYLVLRSNQMIQPIRLRPKRSAVSRGVAVNHVFDSEH